MKKFTILSLVIISIFTSCVKGDDGTCNQKIGNPQASANEITNIQTYLSANSITNAVQHSSGIFYTITTASTGTVTPDQCNRVAVKYVGKLTNGNIFDQSATPVAFNLYSLIMGWRIGIPLIKTGGSIRLYIPPSLGYGDRAAGSIPANSILIFDIDLVSVN